MLLTDYFKRRAAIIKRAQTRTDRLDSGEADASWSDRLQDEWNMEFIKRIEALEALLMPLPVEPPPIPKSKE